MISDLMRVRKKLLFLDKIFININQLLFISDLRLIITLISLDIIWNTFSNNRLPMTIDQGNEALIAEDNVHVRFDLTKNKFKDVIEDGTAPNKNAQDEMDTILSKRTEEYLKEKEVIETQFSNVLIICPKK